MSIVDRLSLSLSIALRAPAEWPIGPYILNFRMRIESKFERNISRQTKICKIVPYETVYI